MFSMLRVMQCQYRHIFEGSRARTLDSTENRHFRLPHYRLRPISS